MQKFATFILGMGAMSALYAAPITFTDTYNPSDVYLSNSGKSIYNYTHNILDNGFNGATDAITGAEIVFNLADDGDRSSENVRIKLDNWTADQSLEVDYGAYHFNVASNLLQADGKLMVSLDVLAGDFFFQSSRLEVSANRTPQISVEAPLQAVPEPTSLALMGLGLVGAALVVRKRKQA